MQARQLPAARGWAWIVEGFRLFRRNPPLITFLVFGYWFLLAAINVFPLIGQVAASLAMPALSVSVANGCRAVDRGDPGRFDLMFSGFRLNLPNLLRLGAIYFLFTLAVLGASTLVDDGLLWQAAIKGQKITAETLRDTNLMAALQFALVLAMPVTMANWFAPLLVAWADMPTGKSLFFSFFSCLRNWRPFLIYGLGVMLISAVLPGLIVGAAAAVSEAASNMVSVAVVMVLVFLFVPTLFASFYVSARDVFVEFAPDVSRPGHVE
ncbi:MAG: BPSS1780 family membrane protein [Candidatus Methylophosphatis roskildensis]|jgi:hypothetical protein|nr:hypothetical protein [Sterolibacteriaceae bacterium]MBK7663014.1 hypothetical protein [Sterolibacteriaceae bacterium]MBK9087124.1 hypothetical protein [Sterolibacteriaceae bacterium]